MKNIKNIIELKNPPEDSNVLWLKDGTLYESTSKGWLPLNESPSITEHYEDHRSSLTYTGSDSKEHTIITDGSFVPNNDGDIIITDSNNEEHTMITEEALNAILANGTVVPISWQHLKELKDNNILVPGYLYRITDYVNTTDITFDGLTSHQFDIILLALTPNTLAEEGWAAMHDNVYDITTSDNKHLKCYIYQEEGSNHYNVVTYNRTNFGMTIDSSDIEINNDTMTATTTLDEFAISESMAGNSLSETYFDYNYFQNTNFATWKVWYSLDNDTARFSWAQEEVPPVINFIYCNGSAYPGDNFQNKEYRPLSVGSNNPIVINNTNYYCWQSTNYTGQCYTTSQYPVVGDVIYMSQGYPISGMKEVGTIVSIDGTSGSSASKGIIYRITNELGELCKLQWNELKTIRDSKALVADTKYRIVDYQCTTVQADTRSAGHQFDIVLLALSKDKLAEEGWAMEHPTDVYDVTFTDGVTKKCWVYKDADGYNLVEITSLLGCKISFGSLEIDETSKVAICDDFESEELTFDIPDLTYNYFQNSNLSAWKVWYCLDNDTSRFAWASNVEQLIDVDSKYSNGVALKRYSAFDGGQGYHTDYYYAWGCSDDEDDGDSVDFLYSKTESLKAGDKLYFPDNDEFKVTNIGSITGRGVIYRLIDEWNNDVGYDFKNVQFKEPVTDGYYAYDGEEVFVYTLSYYDANNNVFYDASMINAKDDIVGDTQICINNRISPSFISGILRVLNRTEIFNVFSVSDEIIDNSKNNNLGGYNNKFKESTIHIDLIGANNNLLVLAGYEVTFINCENGDFEIYGSYDPWSVYVLGKKVLTEN